MRDTIDFTYDFESFNLLLNGSKVEDELFDPMEFAVGGLKEQFIFTCSCGVAGCAGWHFGVKVKTRKHTVEWRTVRTGNDRTSKELKNFYSFDKTQYDDMRLRVMVALFDLAHRSQNGEFVDLIDEDDYTSIAPKSIEDLKRSIDYRVSFNEDCERDWDQKKFELFYKKVLTNLLNKVE